MSYNISYEITFPPFYSNAKVLKIYIFFVMFYYGNKQNI